ncbi:hypothetical protein JHK87_043330 [Glycine soja]|nr:hypothetical protein JHK87_043330 [Glycine soja]
MALECVGGAVLSSFLGAVFQKLASPQVLDFFRGTKIDQKLRKDLENKLLSIQAVLDDAEQKQFGNMQVRDWLIKLKVAMLDVEDVLDEIQHSRLQVQPQSESQTCTCKLPNFFKSSPLSSFNKEINSSMKNVLDDLDDLASRMDNLGLKKASDLVVGSGSGGKVPQSKSSVVESDICCRDADKEMIINWLTSDTDKMLSILSIWGMGGLEIVHTKLKDKLRGNRFLLVLDDVWIESRPKWEAVQNALVCGAQGSRILVTTSSEKFASTMRSKEHELEQLQEDYCWKLFAKHAFRDDNLPRDPGCPEIGMKIVKKCQGLPLVLKSMGSLLHNKSFVSDWENILKSEIWEIEDSDIVPALALSYHHLPPHLKTCFAYCALFPKDYVFHRECLIQLWMAEKFLNCHQGNKSPEEVGQQYFNDLISRSFFQQSSKYEDGFVMHDLLNDLAKYVCGDIYFRFGVDDEGKSIEKLPDSVCNFKHLRSLDLSYTGIEKLPESTCSLYNLQILKLNYCRCLKELPSNLHELTNLHGLEFVNTKIIKVPPHLGKLKNLQVAMSSFDVGKCSEFTIQKFGELNFLHERLSFRELQNIENPSDALAADLKNKTHLVELEFEWNSHQNPDDSAKERDVIVIENLQPSKHLEKLSIINYGVSIGADFHGNSTSSFPSLERLKFSSMKAWKKWECEAVTGAFPCLQYLSIRKCPNLKGDLPEQLLHLKQLAIRECKQLEASAPRALELDLQDFGIL